MAHETAPESRGSPDEALYNKKPSLSTGGTTACMSSCSLHDDTTPALTEGTGFRHFFLVRSRSLRSAEEDDARVKLGQCFIEGCERAFMLHRQTNQVDIGDLLMAFDFDL
jgi:hypothetical protein